VSELPPRVCLAVQKKLITQFTLFCTCATYVMKKDKSETQQDYIHDSSCDST